MSFNEDNNVIYTGLIRDGDQQFYQFDLFVTRPMLKSIESWLNENNSSWYLYRPMAHEDEKWVKDDDQLWENNDGVWLWLFIKEEEIATHFRLAWEEFTPL